MFMDLYPRRSDNLAIPENMEMNMEAIGSMSATKSPPLVGSCFWMNATKNLTFPSELFP